MELPKLVAARLSKLSSCSGRLISEGEMRISSVLIPLIIPPRAQRPEDTRILFEKRAAHISQAGEVCFPGGKIEKGESSRDAAIREFEEETGFSASKLRDIVFYGTFINRRGIFLQVWAAVLDGITERDVLTAPSNDEVEKLFSLGVGEIHSAEVCEYPIETELRSVDGPWLEPLRRAGFSSYKAGKWPVKPMSVLFYESFDELLWGMTAKITKEFVEAFLHSAQH